MLVCSLQVLANQIGDNMATNLQSLIQNCPETIQNESIAIMAGWRQHIKIVTRARTTASCSSKEMPMTLVTTSTHQLVRTASSRPVCLTASQLLSLPILLFHFERTVSHGHTMPKRAYPGPLRSAWKPMIDTPD